MGLSMFNCPSCGYDVTSEYRGDINDKKLKISTIEKRYHCWKCGIVFSPPKSGSQALVEPKSKKGTENG